MDRNSAYVSTVRAETEAIAAKGYAKKVQKLEAQAESKLSLAETKNEIKQKLWGGLLRRLKDEEAISEDTFAKYFRMGTEFLDEKPAQVQKRISEHTENLVVTVEEETWDRLEGFYRKVGILPPAQPEPRVIDVSVVPSGSTERD
jgi:hypothetical protein